MTTTSAQLYLYHYVPGRAVAATWSRIVEPVIEPITLAEAKDQTRYTTDDNNVNLNRYIKTAREAAEDTLNRGLLTQTWLLQRQQFSDVMALPMAAPLQTDVSTAPLVQYYDINGVLQTLDSTIYLVDAINRPARLTLAPLQMWPSVQERRDDAVRITYVVGWQTPAQVPERIKQGIRQYVAYLDAVRDGLDVQAHAAEQAAERCWIDRVYWNEACASALW